MTDGREILTSIIKTTQATQFDLSAAIDFASSTAMKSVLAEQLQSFDRCESLAQQLASQRGWEIIANRQPFTRMKRRMQLHARKTDSDISEYLVNYHTHSIIRELQISHGNKSYDEQINSLLQKLLFCQNNAIRQMHPFL